MWYKVINSDNIIIDVLDALNYVMFQERNRIIISCDKFKAQGILSSNQTNIWHLEDLQEFPAIAPIYDTVRLSEITEEEYWELKEQLESGTELPPEPPEEKPDEPESGEGGEVLTLERVWDKVQEHNTEINTILGKYDVSSISLATFQNYRQEENKEQLRQFLQNNPLLWTDGNYYGVTKDDQDEMIADKAAYELKQTIGETDWKLEWHNVKHACREFTVEEFAALLNEIINFVYPYRKLQETYKEKIYSCTTKEQLIELSFDYNVESLQLLNQTEED